MSITPLLAYIDPVSGSIVLQAIIAAVIGGAAFFRDKLSRGLRWMLRRGRSENS